MPITAADLLMKFSVKTGAAGNTTAGTAAGSLGKYISTTAITDGTLNNLFDDITGPENAGQAPEYRCIFVHNNHASLTLQNAVVYLANVAGGADIAISVDTTGNVALGSASAQAKEVANETIAPAGETFSAPTTRAAGLSIGNLAPGQVRAIWLRRTPTNSAAMNNDGVTITVEGDTAA